MNPSDTKGLLRRQQMASENPKAVETPALYIRTSKGMVHVERNYKIVGSARTTDELVRIFKRVGLTSQWRLIKLESSHSGRGFADDFAHLRMIEQARSKTIFGEPIAGHPDLAERCLRVSDTELEEIVLMYKQVQDLLELMPFLGVDDEAEAKEITKSDQEYFLRKIDEYIESSQDAIKTRISTIKLGSIIGPKELRAGSCVLATLMEEFQKRDPRFTDLAFSQYVRVNKLLYDIPNYEVSVSSIDR